MIWGSTDNTRRRRKTTSAGDESEGNQGDSRGNEGRDGARPGGRPRKVLSNRILRHGVEGAVRQEPCLVVGRAGGARCLARRPGWTRYGGAAAEDVRGGGGGGGPGHGHGGTPEADQGKKAQSGAGGPRSRLAGALLVRLPRPARSPGVVLLFPGRRAAGRLPRGGEAGGLGCEGLRDGRGGGASAQSEDPGSGPGARRETTTKKWRRQNGADPTSPTFHPSLSCAHASRLPPKLLPVFAPSRLVSATLSALLTERGRAALKRCRHSGGRPAGLRPGGRGGEEAHRRRLCQVPGGRRPIGIGGGERLAGR